MSQKITVKKLRQEMDRLRGKCIMTLHEHDSVLCHFFSHAIDLEIENKDLKKELKSKVK